MLQTDVNLYLVFADLVKSIEKSTTVVGQPISKSEEEEKSTSDDANYMPATFREAISLFDAIIEANEDPYYCSLLAHEVNQLYEQNS